MLYLVDLVTKLVLAFTTDSYRTPLVMLVRPLGHWGRLWNLSCGALLQRTGSNASLYTLHQGQLPVVSCRSWLILADNDEEPCGDMRGMCQELGGSKFEWFYNSISDILIFFVGFWNIQHLTIPTSGWMSRNLSASRILNFQRCPNIPNMKFWWVLACFEPRLDIIFLRFPLKTHF